MSNLSGGSVDADNEYWKSLSEAEWDKAVAIETEIGEILQEGWTEETGLKFVRIVMEIRKFRPQVTVGGVYEAALRVGLLYLEDEHTMARIREGQFPWSTGAIKSRQKKAGKRSTLK